MMVVAFCMKLFMTGICQGFDMPQSFSLETNLCPKKWQIKNPAKDQPGSK
jgi:hypothetical protein